MIIDKKVKDKVTGEESVTYSTNKEGFKVLIDKDGNPTEVKMSNEERANRDHGAKTDGGGAKSSAELQTNISKIASSAAKLQREKAITMNKKNVNSMIESSDKNIKALSDKIEKLTLELRKNKVAKKEIELHKLERELMKKQLLYKTAEQFISKDKENLKAKNSFYVQDKPNEKVIAKIDDIVDAMDNRAINESKKLDIVGKIDKFLNIAKKRIYEADKDEEDTTDPMANVDGSEVTPDEKTQDPTTDNPDETDPLADIEDAPEEDLNADVESYVQPNEIENLVTINNYNPEANNVYDFYDKIFPKLIDPTSKKAINAEYSLIPQDKLKVTSANEFYKKVTNRLSKLNKAEDNKINSLASDSGDESGADELNV